MRLRQNHRRSLQPHNEEQAVGQADDFGDEFDDFEEGTQAGEDEDFGEFDNTFEPIEDEDKVTSAPVPEEPIPSFVSVRRLGLANQKLIESLASCQLLLHLVNVRPD